MRILYRYRDIFSISYRYFDEFKIPTTSQHWLTIYCVISYSMVNKRVWSWKRALYILNYGFFFWVKLQFAKWRRAYFLIWRNSVAAGLLLRLNAWIVFAGSRCIFHNGQSRCRPCYDARLQPTRTVSFLPRDAEFDGKDLVRSSIGSLSPSTVNRQFQFWRRCWMQAIPGVHITTFWIQQELRWTRRCRNWRTLPAFRFVTSTSRWKWKTKSQKTNPTWRQRCVFVGPITITVSV